MRLVTRATRDYQPGGGLVLGAAAAWDVRWPPRLSVVAAIMVREGPSPHGGMRQGMTTAVPGAVGSEASSAPRTTAHDRRQLAAALGWTVVQVDKAVILGVLPPHELKTPRWRGATVDDLASRRAELAVALDEAALLTEGEMMARLGLDWGDWRRGRDRGVIPGPDRSGFWSREAAEGLAARIAELRGLIPPQPLGAHR